MASTPLRLCEVDPAFTQKLSQALLDEDYAGSSKLDELVVVQCSYDYIADAGYLYFVHPIAPDGAAETIALMAPYWFNIDLDRDGRVLGVEVFHCSEHVEQLARCARCKLVRTGLARRGP